MQITAVNIFAPAFKSHKYETYDEEFGFIPCSGNSDVYENDYYTQNTMDVLRSRMYERAHIDTTTDVPKYASSIEDIRIPNFYKLPNNSYRGATLAGRDDAVVLLTKTGIETVIDLEGYYSLEKACERNHFEYVKIPMNKGFWKNPIFENREKLLDEKKQLLTTMGGFTKQELKKELRKYSSELDMQRENFVKEFKKLINTVNRGNYYISCQLGDYRTPNMLALISLFNPQWVGEPIEPCSATVYKRALNMYNNLTPKDLKTLEITPEFYKKLGATLVHKYELNKSIFD